MTIKKTELINILFANNIPLIDYFLKQICEDYDLSYDELEGKYIKPFRSTKKRNINKKGKKTKYSMFLADENVNDLLKNKFKEEYDKMSFSEISTEKSKIWKAMSEIDKQEYKKRADNFNEKLKDSKKSN
jgi:hypothetical protein